MSAPWDVTRAAVVGVLAGGALLLVGALVGRVDVALVGAVPLLVAVRDLTRRPSGRVVVQLDRDEAGTGAAGAQSAAGSRSATGSQGAADAPALRAILQVSVPGAAPAALVGLHRGGRPAGSVLLAVHGLREVHVVVRTARTGPQEVVSADAQGVGPGAATLGDVTGRVTHSTLVLPAAAPLREVPLPTRLRGLTGPHPSRRPGEGGDLRDVHPFTPGDRLRRIDWRATAKRSPDLRELYVRREHALGEAAVVLVVDSRDDLGPDPRTWGLTVAPRPDDATSLDLARAAAASLARAVLAAGDRVGLDDLGVLRRPLPPGGGRQQLDRVRHALALTHPEGAVRARLRSPRLPSGALVVVFSTFLDDEAARAAAAWRRAGHRVLAVDVLPTLRTRHLAERDAVAVRLVLLEREDRLADLRDVDVDVVDWRSEPAVALATLARRDRRRIGRAAPR